MGLTFPIDRDLAAKALKLSRKGNKGKAIADALGGGLKAPDANLLTDVGAGDENDESAALTGREQDILLALLVIDRDKRRAGETASTKSKYVAYAAGISVGQLTLVCRKRLAPRDWNRETGEWTGRFGFVEHKANGHIWLTPGGWGAARLVEEMRGARHLDRATVRQMALRRDR